MRTWEKSRLGDVCERVTSGGTPKSTNDEYYNSGDIPWLNTKEIDFNRIYSTEKYITQKGLENSAAKWIEADSVIVAMYGATAGKVAIGKIPLTTNQACCNLTIDKQKANYQFVYYALFLNYSKLASLANGGAQQNLNSNHIKDFEINLPPLAEQQRIANILGALDDKIECNNRINRNLEEQAQALFKRWFIDFEFPDVNGNPYRSSGGEMMHSTLGEIPKGWTVSTFRDIIISTIGGDWGKERAEGNYSQKVYCIRGADITDVSKGDKGKMPFRYILPKNHLSKKLEENDLVVEISGGSPTQSTGRIAIISNSLLKRYDEDMICTNFCRAIKPKAKYAHFIYSLWQYMYDQNIMFGYENGTTGIKNLNINGLINSEQIIIPPSIILNSYDNLQKQFFDAIFSNALESETLVTIRDILLPKLINNEIRT